MEWIQLPVGPLQTNAYVIYNDEGSCLIIDPGEEKNKIRRFIQRKRLQPKAILLTHAHFDHIGAVEAIREEYKIPVYLHQAEKKWLSNPSLNGSSSFEGIEPVVVNPADQLIAEDGEISIGEFTFYLYETPGHSPGGVSFYFKEEGFILVGDTLFEGSIGRTDLKGGQEAQLLKSIRQKLLTLPEDTYVLPGHDGVTTIGQEIAQNPFLTGCK
jgi:glyoxylase-like metal-dependent hydrolase (beta-lactamase superfamily II)